MQQAIRATVVTSEASRQSAARNPSNPSKPSNPGYASTPGKSRTPSKFKPANVKAEWIRPSRSHIRASTLNTGNFNPTMKERQANQANQGDQAQTKHSNKPSNQQAKRFQRAKLNEQAIGFFFPKVIPPFFFLYLSSFVIPFLLIPNFLRYNKSITKYNQKWYSKYFQEILGITNWNINGNISYVVKHPKTCGKGGQRY